MTDERERSDIAEMRAAVHDATETMKWALPVIVAVRAWRDTPRTPGKMRESADLELAILDAINDFDEYAEYER